MGGFLCVKDRLLDGLLFMECGLPLPSAFPSFFSRFFRDEDGGAAPSSLLPSFLCSFFPDEPDPVDEWLL